jgi:hypothetical protein
MVANQTEACHKTDKGFCSWESMEDRLLLVLQSRAVNFHNTDIIGPGFQDDCFQPLQGSASD